MSSNVYLLLTLLVVSVATVSDSGSRIAFAKHIFLVEEETTIV